MKTISAFVFLVAFAPLPAIACLNDRDSDALAAEARRLPVVQPGATREAPDFPGIIEIITGRFPRNPASYYTQRIARCQRELEKDPNQLLLYDDISVAYDKLGKSGEALAWIEKKRPRISQNDTEALYRYFANAGTFRAHRWLREGAKDERIAELAQARDEIAHAIALKPDAHFGREATQLMAMDWILKERTKQSLASFLRETKSSDNQKNIIGLAGLVALGNAWESVDVFGALAGQLNKRGEAKIAFLAELRARELWESGKRSLWVNAPDPKATTGTPGHWEIVRTPTWRDGITNQSNVAAKYKELRAAAEKWQSARTAFMEAQLKANRHPDTDPHFWDGYSEAPAPTLDIPWHKEASANFGNWLMRYGMVSIGFLFWGSILATLIYVFRPQKRRPLP